MSDPPSRRFSTARLESLPPLRTLLIVPILAPLLATAVLTIWWSHRQGSQIVQTQAVQLHQEIANRVNDHLNHYFSQPVFSIQLTAQAIQSRQLMSQDLDGLQSHFWTQSQVFPQLSEIYWGNHQGDFIGVMRDEKGQQALATSQLKPGTRSIIALDAQGRPGAISQQYAYEPKQRPWYQLAQTTRAMRWSNVYRWSRGPILGITLTQPIFDDQEALEGVLAIDLNLGSIQQFLKQLSITRTGQVLIVDRSGFLIASSTEELPFRVQDDDIQRLSPLEAEDPILRSVARQIQQDFGGFEQISQEQTLQHRVDGATQFVHLMPWQDNWGLDLIVMVVVPRATIAGKIDRNAQATTLLNLAAFSLATTLSLLIAHRIARQRRAQTAYILEQESFLRALYEGVEAAIFTMDVEEVDPKNQVVSHIVPGQDVDEYASFKHKQFRCIDVSPAHSRMSRLSREEILNKTPEEYLEPQAAQTVLQGYWTCIETGDRVSYENRLEHEDRVSWWLTTISPVENETGQIHRLIVTGLNITQRKEAELHLANRTQELARTLQELKQTQTKLIESAKMAALGKLIAGVAHEVSTPIGTAILAASMLENETELFQIEFSSANASTTLQKNEASRSNLDPSSLDPSSLDPSGLEDYLDLAVQSSQIILNNLNRAGDLVQRFKQVAVDQTRYQVRPLEFKTYIHEIIQSLTPQFQLSVHCIEIHCDENLVVTTDPGAIAQIITNLIMNSLTHAYQPGENGNINIKVNSNHDLVELRYQDDGRGIASEHLEHIFEPFFTTSSLAHSSGLGMHLVYNLVTQRLRGSITVKSLINQGTEFIVTFPTITPEPVSSCGGNP